MVGSDIVFWAVFGGFWIYGFYWWLKLIWFITHWPDRPGKELSAARMGPTYPGMSPCWERPGCLQCWLFTECYCGKPITSHRNKGIIKVHPENRRQARMAAEKLSQDQLANIFRQNRDWTREDKLWFIPEKEGCDTLYSGVRFVCEDCWNLPDCREKSAKRYRKSLKRIMLYSSRGGNEVKKEPEANLEKAKSRFRTTAWWCLGTAIGLIGGKFFVDFVIYMGMPLMTKGPEKVWSILLWVALVALYVCLYGAFWMGLSIIRKRFKLRTSYDVTMGDVRVIKVDPEIANNLLTYEPTERPQIEMAAEVTAEANEE